MNILMPGAIGRLDTASSVGASEYVPLYTSEQILKKATAEDIANVAAVTNAGVAASGVTAVEWGNSRQHVTVLTVDTTLPAIAGGAALGVGKLLYTLPAGACVINSTKMSLAITQTEGNITADTPDGGIGTTIASGAVSVLSGTAAFENILTGQTFNDCNGTAETTAVGTQLVVQVGDNHTIYFNVADTWASDGDAGALLTGTVTIDWTFLG